MVYRENPNKTNDLGVPLFQEIPIYVYYREINFAISYETRGYQMTGTYQVLMKQRRLWVVLEDPREGENPQRGQLPDLG